MVKRIGRLVKGVLLFSGVFLVSFTAYGQGTFPLRYESANGVDDRIEMLPSVPLERVSKKAAGVKRLPKGVKGEFTYFWASIAGRTVLLAVGPDSTNRLYVDTDFNRSLFGEKGTEASTSSTQPAAKGAKEKTEKTRTSTRPGSGFLEFGPIEVKIPGKQGSTRMTIHVTLSEGRRYGFVRPAGTMVGKVKIGKTEYAVALADGNFNGRYNDFGERGAGDTLGIANTQDGKSGMECLPLAKVMRLGGEYFQVSVDSDGKEIRLTGEQKQLGILDLKGDVELTITSPMGTYKLKGGKKWKLPAGTYEVEKVVLHAIDKENKNWTLWGRGGKEFTLTAGKTTTRHYGPPLAVWPEVREKGRKVLICFTLTGQGGELYIPIAEKDGQGFSAPEYKVVDEKGKVLTSGKFAFRSDFPCPETWQMPKKFKGKYKVDIDVHTGPFEVKKSKR